MPCKYFVNEPEAAITKTRVVYIQKGPYKSGLFWTRVINLLFNGINEKINLSLISSVSISKYFCKNDKLQFNLSRKLVLISLPADSTILLAMILPISPLLLLMLLFVILLLVFAIALCAIKYLGIILIGGGLIYLGIKVLKKLF